MQRGGRFFRNLAPEATRTPRAGAAPALSDEPLLQRALEGEQTASFSPGMVRTLSRLVGNQATQRMIQRALGAISHAPAPSIQRGTDDDIITHGYDKHVVQQKEWGDPPISKEDYRKAINDVLASPENKPLKNGRHAYWKAGVIVIVNSSKPSQSTCFKPTTGKSYYDKQV